MRWFLLQLLIRVAFVAVHVGSLATFATILSVTGYAGSALGVAVFWIFILQVLCEGWAFYAYLRYRNGRREEVQQLLRAAVSSQVPLEPALHQYLRERKTEPVTMFVQLFFAILITPLVPCALFLWGWLYIRRFDRRAEQFEQELYDGTPLDDAVLRHPAVLNTEARLAVRVGVATGKLELALERCDRDTTVTPWLEIVPRLFYPLLILFLVNGVLTFSLVSTIPKFKKIFDEFGTRLPPVTKSFINTGTWLEDYGSFFGLLFLISFVLVVFATFSTRLCWHLPIVGYFYRREHRGRTLRMLGLMLEAEIPPPAALDFLAESEEIPDVVRARLRIACRATEHGTSLADALTDANLLTASMTAIVAAGQQVGTLPWTLQELGEHSSRTALRRATRLSLLVGPLLLIAIGLYVAFAAVGLFMPLITLMEVVSQQ